MLGAEEAIKIYSCLMTHGIKVWVVGGWGIDALLGRQTRPHKDLDLLLLLDDTVHLCALLGEQGFSLKEVWSENRYAVDANGTRTPTAFVLQDGTGLELDMHALHFDELNNAIPDWEEDEGFTLTMQDLAGGGTIAGTEVACMSAEKQMSCHTGYMLPDYQRGDLQLLHTECGVDFPDELSHLRLTENIS